MYLKTMVDAVSNLQLNDYFRNERKYRGTFSRDNLPDKKLKLHEGLILNLDESSGSGSHWVALFKFKHKGQIYFDPFGLAPPQEVISFSKPDALLYSTGQIQDIKSSKCGLYCMLVLRDLFNGKSLYNSIYQFDQNPSDFNEKKAKGLKTKLT